MQDKGLKILCMALRVNETDRLPTAEHENLLEWDAYELSEG